MSPKIRCKGYKVTYILKGQYFLLYQSVRCSDETLPVFCICSHYNYIRHLLEKQIRTEFHNICQNEYTDAISKILAKFKICIICTCFEEDAWKRDDSFVTTIFFLQRRKWSYHL